MLSQMSKGESLLLTILTAMCSAVLSVLARSPRRELSVRACAREAGVSVGAASQALRTLRAAGVVKCRREGRSLLCRLDLASPVARQWKVLANVLELVPVVEALRAHSCRVVLFGSGAVGTDDEESDLDVFVEAPDPEKAREAIGGIVLSRHLQALVRTPSEAAELAEKQPALWENISSGLVLWDAGRTW